MIWDTAMFLRRQTGSRRVYFLSNSVPIVSELAVFQHPSSSFGTIGTRAWDGERERKMRRRIRVRLVEGFHTQRCFGHLFPTSSSRSATEKKNLLNYLFTKWLWGVLSESAMSKLQTVFLTNLLTFESDLVMNRHAWSCLIMSYHVQHLHFSGA